MLKEEKKAIDELKGLLMAFGYQGNIDNQKEWNYLRDEEPDNYKTAKAIETVLSLIQSQQKEIEKKDKIIDLMAEELSIQYNSCEPCELSEKAYIICKDYKNCKECIKQYFEKKVEGK